MSHKLSIILLNLCSLVDSQDESQDESHADGSDDDTDNNPHSLQRLTDELRTTLSLLDSEHTAAQSWF